MTASVPASSAGRAELLSIVVPALNEADNLPSLAARVHAAMAGRPYELLIVDDNSRDRTPEVCASLAERFPLRLLVRAAPQAGLSGAVLHGFAHARGDVFVVMDADLQHPPEKLPALIAAIEVDGAPFALGSRYVPGGSTRGEWGRFRQLNSRAATWLALPFAPGVRDPMSGFFALRRSTFARADRLAPTGYKIALELISKCNVGRVQEVPIDFGLRERGHSKLTFREQLRYLNHVSRLYDFRYPRLSPVAKFLIAVTLGWTVGAMLFEASLVAGMRPQFAIAVGYLGVIAVTAILHLSYMQRQREYIIRPKPWRDFWMIACCELGVAALAFAWIHRYAGATMHLWHQALFAAGTATVARYVLRKELLQDIRGLRKDLRVWELS